MKKKELVSKIKKVLHKRDSRFWLMIFVVLSTLFVLFLWIFSSGSYFSKDVSISSDIDKMGLSGINLNNEEFNSFFDNIGKTLETFNEGAFIENENNYNIDRIEEDEIEHLKSRIEAVLEERENTSTSTETDSMSEEIIKSDEIILELKRQIKELEERLDN